LTGGLYNHTGGDWFVQLTESAGLRLYYAGAVKLETLTGGVSVTGDISATTYGTYGLSGGNVPPSGAQILRSHTNGYTYVGWLNTVSGTATSPSRFYCSQDAFLRYQTASNFRDTLEAITGWDFNGATKPRIDGGAITYYVDNTYVGGKITVASSAPGSPTKGDIWFDTT